ncbi:MAG: hypothetical protein L0H70_03950, partial [Xanthomonadales bacterium]|nr:hypothetical protein [Xanthomonadales bacterium]
EIVFLRKGSVMLPGGKTQATWWLLANGHIRSDGRLISGGIPFGGITASGDYVVCRVAAGVPTGHVVLHIPRGDWVSFDGLNVSLAAGLQDASNADPVTGALARAASGLSVGAYHYGVPQFGHMPPPKIPTGKSAGKPQVMQAGNVLPRACQRCGA